MSNNIEKLKEIFIGESLNSKNNVENLSFYNVVNNYGLENKVLIRQYKSTSASQYPSESLDITNYVQNLINIDIISIRGARSNKNFILSYVDNSIKILKFDMSNIKYEKDSDGNNLEGCPIYPPIDKNKKGPINNFIYQTGCYRDDEYNSTLEGKNKFLLFGSDCNSKNQLCIYVDLSNFDDLNTQSITYYDVEDIKEFHIKKIVPAGVNIFWALTFKNQIIKRLIVIRIV